MTKKAAEILRSAASISDSPRACFEGDRLEYEDRRRDYGEHRYVAVGEVDGEVLFVVYAWRGADRRIISARRASRRERDAYCETFGKANR